MSSVHQIFVCFDVDHDRDLYELLDAQSKDASSGFAVSGGSERSADLEVGRERVLRRIRKADQVIVICGEHTAESARVSSEMAVALEEETPYFLLWGRREVMCTKPAGAKPTDGMYSWTRQILKEQMILGSQRAAAAAEEAPRR